MTKPKIAIILHKTDLTGGPGHTLLNSIEFFNREEFEYSFLVSERGELVKVLSDLGFDVKFIKYAEISKKNPVPFILCFFKALIWLKQNKIQLLHFQFDYYRDPFFQAAKFLNLKTVMHIRGYSQNPKKGWFDSADQFIFNSNLTRANPRFELIPEEKKVVVHNGINPNYFKPIIKKEKSNSGCYVIGNISRIHPAKKLEDFLQIAKLLNPVLSAEFRIIGNIQDKEYYKKLNELVNDNGLSEIVKFVGHQSNISKIYEELDLIIHTADAEPFGMVYFEAALARVPIIANRPGGIEDIAVDREDVLYYQFGEVQVATQLALEVLNNKELASKLTNNFYEKVSKHHTAQSYQRKLEEVYDGLLN